MGIYFSALLSLYKGEKREFFDKAMNSIYEQTLLPNEVIIVHDGPLTQELYDALDYWNDLLPIKEIILDINHGLGYALNKGLNACSYDLVFRVDTDDINDKDRFRIQYDYMINHPEISVLGSNITEFSDNEVDIVSKRIVPSKDFLAKKIAKNNPMNHMSVVFRKKDVLAVGGYQPFYFMEDYYLWLRMYAAGFKLDNLDDYLVNARVGNGMLNRRRGWKYCKSEIRMMKEIMRLDISRSPYTFFYFLSRAFSRLLPSFMMKVVYSKIRH